MEQVKILLLGGIMPKKSNPTDAAYDLFVPRDVRLHTGRQVVDLEFAMELPHGKAATIQPRSGFSAHGIEVEYTCFKSFDEHYRLDADVIRGLVDEKYRGNVGVILYVREKFSDEEVRVILKKGTRLAQMQIVAVPQVELVETDGLDMSEDRGGGFGHTGV